MSTEFKLTFNDFLFRLDHLRDVDPFPSAREITQSLGPTFAAKRQSMLDRINTFLGRRASPHTFSWPVRLFDFPLRQLDTPPQTITDLEQWVKHNRQTIMKDFELLKTVWDAASVPVNRQHAIERLFDESDTRQACVYVIGERLYRDTNDKLKEILEKKGLGKRTTDALNDLRRATRQENITYRRVRNIEQCYRDSLLIEELELEKAQLIADAKAKEWQHEAKELKLQQKLDEINADYLETSSTWWFGSGDEVLRKSLAVYESLTESREKRVAEYHQSIQELNEAKKALQEKDEALGELDAKRIDVQRQYRELRETHTAEVNELGAQNTALTNANTGLEARTRQLNEANAALEARTRQLNETNVALEAKLADHSDLTAQLAAAQAALEACEKDKANLNGPMEATESSSVALDRAQTARSVIEATEARLKERVDNLDAELKASQAEVARLTTVCAAASAIDRKAESELATKRNAGQETKSKLEEELEALKAKVDNARATKNSAETELKTTKAKLKASRAIGEKLSAERNAARAAEAGLEKRVERAEAALAKATRGVHARLRSAARSLGIAEDVLTVAEWLALLGLGYAARGAGANPASG